MSWVERVEAVLGALKGSSIGEIELAEGDLEIIVRRDPGTTIAVAAQQHAHSHPIHASHSDKHIIEMKTPLTGVYYSAPSPTAAPFINVGDLIQIGQTVAVIEAMKVFSEIPSDVTGRVVAIKAKSGAVIKKGEVLLQVVI